MKNNQEHSTSSQGQDMVYVHVVQTLGITLENYCVVTLFGG